VLIKNSLAKNVDDVNNSGLLLTYDLIASEVIKASGVNDAFRKTPKQALRVSISGALREISSQSSIASSPEKNIDTSLIGENVPDQEFGGLTSLMISDGQLADSFFLGGAHCRNGTISTRSESDEDRAIKFSISLKRI
jgi:hypothetical protein